MLSISPEPVSCLGQVSPPLLCSFCLSLISWIIGNIKSLFKISSCDAPSLCHKDLAIQALQDFLHNASRRTYWLGHTETCPETWAAVSLSRQPLFFFRVWWNSAHCVRSCPRFSCSDFLKISWTALLSPFPCRVNYYITSSSALCLCLILNPLYSTLLCLRLLLILSFMRTRNRIFLIFFI